ncbi:hypothetical protein BV20DRAFT_958984 [Pilatotrama ljubarskyi]|nr:hypothetical protein BV20DRAFT_958984 [Pilatotrama ljubarskyi]
MPLPCNVCGIPTTHRCGGCNNKRYCSQEHAQEGWASHKMECHGSAESINLPATQFPAPTTIALSPAVPARAGSPSTIYVVRAFIFQPGECAPRCIDVTYDVIDCTQGKTAVPYLDAHFAGGPGEGSPRTAIVWNGAYGEKLRQPLEVWYCPDAIRQGAPINWPIVGQTRGPCKTLFCGTVIVLRFSGIRLRKYVDINDHDLSRLAAYFAQFTLP